MRKIMQLLGKNHQSAAEWLGAVAALDPWLVLMNRDITLDQYLTTLHDDHALSNSILSRLKICRYLKWEAGAVRFQQPGTKPAYPNDIVELLKLLRESGRPEIVITNGDPVLYAEILQQLVYLDYPQHRIIMKLGEADGERGKIAWLFTEAAQLITLAQLELQKLPPTPLRRELDASLEKCWRLLADGAPLKLALAASKKSGKSTLLNCMLGADLAPRSFEVATPNSCEYRHVPGGPYHLEMGGEGRDFTRPKALKKYLEDEFARAQKLEGAGFALPDMRVSYPDENNLPPGWNLLDTPGPDAAGTAHRQSAQKALGECDAAIFLIDYNKYITEAEYKYLDWIRAVFEGKGGFRNLVFAINKMDLALQDNGAKSWVKSIDFIRNRLIAINPEFAQCVIFPISALDYANLLTLRAAAQTEPVIADLLRDENRWTKEAQDRIDELEEVDDDVLTAASALFAETRRMKRILGIREPTTEALRNLSGVPQLLEHTLIRLKTCSDQLRQDKGAALCAPEIARILGIIANAKEPEKGQYQRICHDFLSLWEEIEAAKN